MKKERPKTYSLRKEGALLQSTAGKTGPVGVPIFARREMLIFYLLLVAIITVFAQKALALGAGSYITEKRTAGAFVLSVSGRSAPVCISSNDYWGVIHAAKDLQSDIEKITDAKPELLADKIPSAMDIVVAGTIGKSPFIDELIRNKKLDVQEIEGKWESFIIKVVNKPFPGVGRALVIVGSDKRGTIYGIYDVSEKIGISPWYWWADVPPRHRSAIYVKSGTFEEGPPSVRYRGIFLNDEWPDLTNWMIHTYGYVKPSEHPPLPPDIANYGHEFYERVFDLLLRLKANYLWPAMWNNAFNEDDSLNPIMANDYGIVMGTSHQEPMLRAQKEWDRRYMKTLGNWNFAKFPDTLESFWRKGIARNKNFESIITIGLRGENDTPMIPGGSLTEDTTLLGNIIRVEENILAEEINPDVAKIPQLWCPYSEVLGYYNAGFRVPDYATILWPDNNFGDIRRLPTDAERERSGGAGVYYHFDLHGGPRSYQWINTNALPKIWDQMTLAKEYGADRVWIVNVGHLKGYELPISYFMDLAWNASRWTNDNIAEYALMWARQQFGPEYASQIADILLKYSKYNSRRKPELLSPKTYSVVDYNEAENVVADFKSITDEAERIYNKIPADERDAFYELVLFPTKASYILNDMYYAAGRNELYAKQGRAATNEMLVKTKELFAADTSLMGYFNRSFDNAKWDGFMDQPFIGYKSWSQPPENNLDAIDLKKIDVPEAANMGVSIQGSESSWPGADEKPALPCFDPFKEMRHYVVVFNKGKTPFKFTARSDKSWIQLSTHAGEVKDQTKLWVSIDWKKAQKTMATGNVIISGTGHEVSVAVNVINPTAVTPKTLKGFIEENGYVSIEAAHYTRLTNDGTRRWLNIQDYGRTLSGMRATAPLDFPDTGLVKNAPCIEYKMFLFDSGKVDVQGIFGPTLNFDPARGLHYAVSFDDQPPVTVALIPENSTVGLFTPERARAMMDNVRYSDTSLTVQKPGYHTLKVWMIDPGVVLEKIVLNFGRRPDSSSGVKPSYLGPPESFHRDVANEK
jgi:hypothetical protein